MAQETPRRFLFLFSDTGGGHRAAARAVADEMARLYGARVEVTLADLFVEMGRWPFDRFPRWYPRLVRGKGVPWSVSYHLSNRRPLMVLLSDLTWPYARASVCDVLRAHDADVIVSFHGIPNRVLVLARRCLRWNVPLAVVVLDLVTIHAGWFTPGADLYLVPTEAAQVRALDCGVPAERIAVTGMPTRRRFFEAMALPQAEARAQLGLPLEREVVLLMGGGEGMGPLVPLARAVAARCRDARVVAVAGRNQALGAALRALNAPNLRVEGYISNVEVWMRAADVLLTKAGPNTICEACIAGLPLVLYAALPGQEVGNVDYVVEHGAGVWSPGPEQAAAAVARLLASPAARQQMAERARELAYPQAGESIAGALWEMGDSVSSLQ